MYKTVTLEPLFYFTLSPLLPFSTLAAGHCVPLCSTVHRVWPHHQHSSKVFFSSFLTVGKRKSLITYILNVLKPFYGVTVLSNHNFFFLHVLLYSTILLKEEKAFILFCKQWLGLILLMLKKTEEKQF
jgi:hypothetical protein